MQALGMILPIGPHDGEGKRFDPLNKDTDCFKPPDNPVEVGCLHCGCIYMSSQMTWRVETNSEGQPMGFWCCPDPLCDGKGFGFDLLPTDPNYRDENGGWVTCDDEEDDELDEWDEDDEFDGPSNSFDPPKDWTDDDLEDEIPF